ncbi:MAG: hypothetical protein K2X90_01260 [Candidatus Babeliaceae bacterium]|nr:hypothetical protein [Candidatus Babeliaceae bacterium]
MKKIYLFAILFVSVMCAGNKYYQNGSRKNRTHKVKASDCLDQRKKFKSQPSPIKLPPADPIDLMLPFLAMLRIAQQ